MYFKYLDVDSRINLVNRRLEVLKDLNSIVTILEWIIIVLIVADILIEGFRGWREMQYEI